MHRQESKPNGNRRHGRRAGFTLVELLVVITIIVMLAGFTLAALSSARESARAAKTQSMIARLNAIIMPKYESYMTRRVPISTSGLNPNDAAALRLKGLRWLQVMEMPERKADIPQNPSAGMNIAVGIHTRLVQAPAAAYLFRSYWDTANSGSPASDEYAPAECLYMIVSLSMPEGLANFSQEEIGDVDGDGAPEFVDGWGRPIMFLRWAPGFTGQSAIQSGDTGADHDPFDPRGVDSAAYHLIPLIYSAGPDGKYDLELNASYVYGGDPYASNAGAPTDADGNGLNHHDNLHNHQLDQRMTR